MSKKRKTQIGYESFPFDEFADMLTINPSESQKLLRKLATESKTKTEQDDQRIHNSRCDGSISHILTVPSKQIR